MTARHRERSGARGATALAPTGRPAADTRPAEIQRLLTGLLAGQPRGSRAKGRPSATSMARRGGIITAAIRVIARDGLRACTISALERETGFARGHFTYHFRSKDEIIGLAFAAVGSDWAATQIEAYASGSAVDRLANAIRATATWVSKNPEYFQCLMNFRVEMMRNPRAFPLAKELRVQIWGAAAQIIRDGIAEGTMQPPADPEVEARILFATVDGFMMYAMMDASFCPAHEVGDQAWALVARRLGIAHH